MTEKFYSIPEEVINKEKEIEFYLPCYCFVLFNRTYADEMVMTKKYLYQFLRIKRANIKERVDYAFQQVLNDFTFSNITFSSVNLNELIKVDIDVKKLKHKKLFAKIYIDDYKKLNNCNENMTTFKTMIEVLCYYRLKMLKRNDDRTPPILYKYLIEISDDLNLPYTTINHVLKELEKLEIIKLYRMKNKKTPKSYITGKLIIYDFINRDDVYSQEEILTMSIEYINKKYKEAIL